MRAFEITYKDASGVEEIETVEAEESGQAVDIFWEGHEDLGEEALLGVVEI